jgi:LacI family transcriptional regulator
MEHPHVFVSGGVTRGPFNSVYYDSEWAGYIAARHVCEQGHRHIAMPILAPEDWGDAVRYGEKQGWIAERFAGATRACRYYNAELISLPVVPADLGARSGGTLFPNRIWERSGEPVARRFADLSGPSQPTAIIALNDEMAIFIIRRLREMGTRVPESVSMLGFDNTEEGRIFHLTTVEPPIEELGREAAILLDRLISAGPPPPGEHPLPVQHILVKPTLVQRGSVLQRNVVPVGESIIPTNAPRLATGHDRGDCHLHRTYQNT